MQDVSIAVFIGVTFAAGFIGRTLFGAFRKTPQKPEEDVILIWDSLGVSEDKDYAEIKHYDQIRPDNSKKFRTLSERSEYLREIVRKHENTNVLNLPDMHSFKNGFRLDDKPEHETVFFRILPPAKNHEVFSRSSVHNFYPFAA